MTSAHIGPAAIAGPKDSSGQNVGCKSACFANLDGDQGRQSVGRISDTELKGIPTPADSPNCCSGSYDTPATCPASGVQYYSYFSAFAISCASPADPPHRGQLSGFVRLCLRREQRHRALDLQQASGLHDHILPVNWRAAEPIGVFNVPFGRPCLLSVYTLYLFRVKECLVFRLPILRSIEGSNALHRLASECWAPPSRFP